MICNTCKKEIKKGGYSVPVYGVFRIDLCDDCMFDHVKEEFLIDDKSNAINERPSNSHKKHRIGFFYISDYYIGVNKDQELVKNLLKKIEFVPTEVRSIFHMGCFKYTGYSFMFEEIDIQEEIPEYSVIFKDEDPDETIISIERKK